MSLYINVSNVKKITSRYNRRISKQVINMLSSHVEKKVTEMCLTHNGGKKTIDSSVASLCGIDPGK